MCYHCNKFGHYANVCPIKRGNPYGESDMVEELGKRQKPDISMKLEKLFKYRDEEEKTDRLLRQTGPGVVLKDFRPKDITSAVAELANRI